MNCSWKIFNSLIVIMDVTKIWLILSNAEPANISAKKNCKLQINLQIFRYVCGFTCWLCMFFILAHVRSNNFGMFLIRWIVMWNFDWATASPRQIDATFGNTFFNGSLTSGILENFYNTRFRLRNVVKIYFRA